MIYFFLGEFIGLLNYFNLNFIFLGEIILLLILGIKSILLKSDEKEYLIYILPILLFIVFLTIGFLISPFYYSNTFKNILKYIITIIEIISVYKCLKFNNEKYSNLLIGFFTTGAVVNYFQMYNKFYLKTFIHLIPIGLLFVLVLGFVYKKEINSLLPLGSIIAISIYAASRTNLFIGLSFIIIFIFNKYIIKTKTNKYNIVKKIFFMIFLIGFMSYIYNFFLENISMKTASNNERTKLIDIAIIEFKKNPVIGIGIGNYNKYAQEVLNYYFRADNLTTHNIYLELLAETGIIGFTLFNSLLIILWIKIIKIKSINIKYIFYYLLFYYFFNTFNGINRFAFATLVGVLIYFIENEKMKECKNE